MDPTSHYDSVVEAWGELMGDDLHYGYFASEDENLADATAALTQLLVKLAQPSANEQVLDIGCGTGNAACVMAQNRGCSVTGISPSQACIDSATRRAQALGLDHKAVFQIGDGTAPNFADESFDLVWIMESSHLMENKAALLAESARVLKPGGRLVLCDIISRRKLSLAEVIEHRDPFLLLMEVFGRAKMETLDFYRDHLQAAGMASITLRDISAQTRPTFAHWRRNADSFAGTLQGNFDSLALEQFNRSCEVLEQFWDKDILGYGLISAHKPYPG